MSVYEINYLFNKCPRLKRITRKTSDENEAFHPLSLCFSDSRADAAFSFQLNSVTNIFQDNYYQQVLLFG